MSNKEKKKLKFYPSNKKKQFHIYTTYTDIFKQKRKHTPLTHTHTAKQQTKDARMRGEAGHEKY